MSGRRWIALAALLLVPACKQGQTTTQVGCASDSDCDPGFTCGTGGACLCLDDDSCLDDEFCNPRGSCQLRTGCVTNRDCDGGFCDTDSGQCIEEGSCRSKIHCRFGQVCDPSGECVDGCDNAGDCELGRACIGGHCADAGECTDKAFCPYGETCDVSHHECVPMPGVYCDRCEPTGAFDACGNPHNLCLIDSSVPPISCSNDLACDLLHNGASCSPVTETDSQCGKNFCSMPCAGEDDCPNGYACYAVQVLTGMLCTEDDDCNSHVCVRTEGEEAGSCTCASDSDCDGVNWCRPPPEILQEPFEELLAYCGGGGELPAGACPNGDPCTVEFDCILGLFGKSDCPDIPCQDGQCAIAAACGPVEGISCEQLNPDY